MELPFDDCSFDAATMGYGLRNVANIPAALKASKRGACACNALFVCTQVDGSESECYSLRPTI